jgi:peptidyl-prolyl cis-trans isomerase C
MGRSEMIHRIRLGAAAALVLAPLALAVAGCGGSGASRPASGTSADGQARVWRPGAPDTLGPTVAIVGSRRVRAHEVDSLIETAPPNLRTQLREKEGYKSVIDRIVVEEAVYQAAQRSGVERDPDFRAALARVTREVMIRTYYEKAKAALPPPSDSAIQAYYDAHASEYEIAPRARIRHIQLPTRAKAASLRKRIQSGGLWDALARANSTDPLTRDQGGVLGFVTPANDYVPGIGKSASIVAAAFTLKEGQTSQPLKSDKAWHLIRVDNVEGKRTQPLAEVRSRIASQLMSEREDRFSKEFIDSLRAGAGAVVFDDSIAVAIEPAHTAQDFFKQAQAAVSPAQRIELYRGVVSRFPNDPVSIQAQFMIGFTYAEEMGEYDKAREEFQKFIAAHPSAELANSARWMLENMDKPAPDLKDGPEGEGGTGASPDSTR